MNTGSQLVLDIVSNDASLPVFYPDKIISQGSLMLMDFNKSYGTLISPSIPSNGSIINNIAWEQAKSVVGSGDVNSLSSPIITSGSSSGQYAIEFTGKRGLHFVNSQVTQSSGSTTYWRSLVPPTILSYMATNYNHTYFISKWSYTTRDRITAASSDYPSLSLLMQNTGNYLVLHPDSRLSPGRFLPESSVGTGLVLSRRDTNGLGINKIQSVAVSGRTGGLVPSGTSVTSNGNFFMNVGIGDVNSYQAASAANKRGSEIVYRLYIEDLTVSQRTASEVDALDYDMFTKAFASGGRLNGDTWTNPATLLP